MSQTVKFLFSSAFSLFALLTCLPVCLHLFAVCLPRSLFIDLCFLSVSSSVSHVCPSFLARPNLALCVSARFSSARTRFLLRISQFTSLPLQSTSRLCLCVHAGTRPFLINLFHLAQHPHEWRRAKLVPVKPAVYSHTWDSLRHKQRSLV